MLKIGLTGGIGSGKSTVAGIFRTLGVPVYIADLEARLLLEDDARIRESVVALLGPEAYADGAKPDRKYIASRVFQNPAELKALNEIIHPRVKEHFEEWTQQHQLLPYVLHEAAILFESGFYQMMDTTIVVWAPEQIRHARVMERDGVSREEILLRQKHQWTDAQKVALAGFVINNDGGHSLIRQVTDLDKTIRHFNPSLAVTG